MQRKDASKKKIGLFTFISESIVEPEVRQVDSSSSIFRSQHCFGYSSFLNIALAIEVLLLLLLLLFFISI